MTIEPLWIEVSERLPEHGQHVIFVVNVPEGMPNRHLHGRLLGGMFHGGESWHFTTPGVGYDATHWMPMPEGPKP